jgi:hypothetical protein
MTHRATGGQGVIKSNYAAVVPNTTLKSGAFCRRRAVARAMAERIEDC